MKTSIAPTYYIIYTHGATENKLRGSYDNVQDAKMAIDILRLHDLYKGGSFKIFPTTKKQVDIPSVMEYLAHRKMRGLIS